MNKYRVWRLFHKPERHFHMLSYRLLDTGRKLNELNRRREVIQRKIVELSKDLTICSECKGGCCRGNYDHYTMIDFMIRSFSDKPLKGYGNIWKPKSLFALASDNTKIFSVSKASNYKTEEEGCPHLSFAGCTLDIEDRPIRCVIWTCRDFRESLPDDELIEIGALINELDSISGEVVKIFDQSH